MARAILRGTPVLVLDEPTSGLDDESARRILDPLRQLARERSVLVITHDARATDIADTVLELRNGRLAIRMREPT